MRCVRSRPCARTQPEAHARHLRRRGAARRARALGGTSSASRTPSSSSGTTADPGARAGRGRRLPPRERAIEGQGLVVLEALAHGCPVVSLRRAVRPARHPRAAAAGCSSPTAMWTRSPTPLVRRDRRPQRCAIGSPTEGRAAAATDGCRGLDACAGRRRARRARRPAAALRPRPSEDQQPPDDQPQREHERGCRRDREHHAVEGRAVAADPGARPRRSPAGSSRRSRRAAR